MAPSIEELDATVRAFYEGRGDTVSISLAHILPFDRKGLVLTRWINSKKLLKPHLTRYESFCAHRKHTSIHFVNSDK